MAPPFFHSATDLGIELDGKSNSTRPPRGFAAPEPPQPRSSAPHGPAQVDSAATAGGFCKVQTAMAKPSPKQPAATMKAKPGKPPSPSGLTL